MRIATIILALLSCSYPALQSPPKPTIAPYFDRIDDGPGFFVECVNTKNVTISSDSSFWPEINESIRLDGRFLEPSGNLFGPGLTMQVGPGQQWRGIIVLRQSAQSYFPAVKFGALRRIAGLRHLAEGRHTIAVKCGEAWSDELVFYWDGERHGNSD
jgi:hypothetical protein